MHKDKADYDNYSREDLLNELLRAKQELDSKSNYFRNLYKDAGIAIGLWSEDGILISLNEQAVKLLNGTKAEDFVGKSISEIINEDYGRLYLERIKLAIDSGDMLVYADKASIAPGNKWFNSVYKAIYDDNNNLIGVQILVIDITAQKEVESLLQERDDRLRNIVEHSTNLFYSHTPNHMLTYLSPQAQHFFDCDAEEAKQLWTEFVTDNPINETGFQSTVRAIVTGQAQPPYELELVGKKGRKIWVEVHEAPIIKDGKTDCIVGALVDITDRKIIEEELSRSEEKYRYLIESSSQGIFVAQDFRLKFVNKYIENLLGFSRKKLASRTFLDFVHPDDKEKVMNNYNRQINGEISQMNDQARIITKDNQVRWVEVNGVKIDWEGAPAALNFINDITPQKEADLALQDAQEHIRALSDGSFEAIFLSDDGVCLGQNMRAQQMFGYNDEEIIGKKCTDWIAPEYYETVIKNMREEFDEPYEAEALRKDGSRFPAIIQGRIMTYRGRQIQVTSLRDITERKKTEMALERSEEIYRKLVENATEGIMVIQNEKVQFINSRVTKITGYTLSDLGTMQQIEIIHPDDRDITLKYFRARMTDGIVPDFYSVRMITKQGDLRWVQVGGVKIDWEGHPALLIFLMDITERKLMEEELAKAEKLESLGVLAGGIAHDFNNILVAIMGNISLAKMSLKGKGEIFSLLNEAEKATDRAKDLTQQLLTFAKGGQPVKMTTDIEHIIRDAAGFSLHGSKVVCQIDIAEDLYPVAVDQGQLNQVFQNLIINASQAMEQGGKITVLAENLDSKGIILPPFRPGKYLHIQVRDEGTGIPEHYLQKIFDPFFTTKVNGTGLGLASCYSIINRHNGLITVDSTVGVGTTFHIYLSASEQQLQMDNADEEPAFKGTGRILVLDDDESVLNVADNILKRMGYSVEIAKEGDQALKMVREAIKSDNRYFMIICDLTIPGGKGGKEIINDVLKIDPEIIAIVSSGYSNDFHKTDYKDYGFSAFLSKPYKTADISRILNEVSHKSRKK